MYVHTAQFQFLLFLCQKESKFGRGAVSSAAWLGPWVSSLVDWVGFCLVRLGVICLGFYMWVGTVLTEFNV